MMPNNPLKQSFESITPTDSQKKRMLINILQKTEQKSVSKVIPFSCKAKPFLTIAASFIIIASATIIFTHMGHNPISHSPSIPNAPQSTTHFVIYNNTYYTYGDELTNLSPEDLIGPLDKIENFGGDFDVIWELKGHDPKYTIIVEHLGSYYLCKNIN